MNSSASAALGTVTFLALGADDFSPEFSGEGIRLCLDGNIQVNGQPLRDTKGPSKNLIVKTLSDHYRRKGEEFLKDVSGGFRLALWDAEKRKLILAVDPFATRPVYYSCVNDVLVFAPRVSCFSGLPGISREIDLNVVYFYLNHSFIPAPFTIYRDIRRARTRPVSMLARWPLDRPPILGHSVQRRFES